MMDEPKMEELELPDTGESYDDLLDASEEFAEEKPEKPFAAVISDDLSNVDMPVISEMDGSDIAFPSKKAEEPVSPRKPAEPKPMFEEMSAPAVSRNTQPATSQNTQPATSKNAQPAAPSEGNSGQSASGSYQSTAGSYQSTAGSYQSAEGSYQSAAGTSDTRTSSSIDDFYNARNEVDPDKYEKGKKKTRIVAGAGIAVYGYNTISYLISLINHGGLSALLHLGLEAFLLYLFIRFFIGSKTAKETLAIWIGVDVVYNIIGLITAGIGTAAFSVIGLGGLFGGLAVMSIITLIARCVMLYFLVLDDDVSEYSKNKQ